MIPPDINTPYHQVLLQYTEQREKLVAVTQRVERVEQQVGGVLTTVREDIRENNRDIKDALETHRVSTETFVNDVYNKINNLRITDAARSGASALSWKLIAAFGAVATVMMGLGSLIWFLATHMPH